MRNINIEYDDLKMFINTNYQGLTYSWEKDIWTDEGKDVSSDIWKIRPRIGREDYLRMTKIYSDYEDYIRTTKKYNDYYT